MTAAAILQSLDDYAPHCFAELDETDTSLDETAFLLQAARAHRAAMRDVELLLEQRLVRLAGTDRKPVVEGLGQVEIRRKTKRLAWRHDEMIPAVVSRIVDERDVLWDPESGSMLPPAQIGANVTARLRECVSFGAGKVTGLRALGLQPDEFCREEPDGVSVQLPARDSYDGLTERLGA